MKATSSFNMDKEVKRILATMEPSKRSEYKNRMINAQLAFEQAKRDALRTKRNDSSGDE